MKRSLNSNRRFLFCLFFLLFFSLGMSSRPKPPAVTTWWLSLDLGKTCSLTKATILWNSAYGSTNYALQGSGDNKTWANLQTNLSSAGATQKDHIISGNYRYLRILISKAAKTYPVIYEVKVYGTIDTTGPTLEITSPKDGDVLK